MGCAYRRWNCPGRAPSLSSPSFCRKPLTASPGGLGVHDRSVLSGHARALWPASERTARRCCPQFRSAFVDDLAARHSRRRSRGSCRRGSARGGDRRSTGGVAAAFAMAAAAWPARPALGAGWVDPDLWGTQREGQPARLAFARAGPGARRSGGPLDGALDGSDPFDAGRA